MAVNETQPVSRAPRAESEDYQEPDPSELRRLPRVDVLGQTALLLKDGFRIKLIDDDAVVLEPRQEGVTAYPPVQVTEKNYARDLNRLTP